MWLWLFKMHFLTLAEISYQRLRVEVQAPHDHTISCIKGKHHRLRSQASSTLLPCLKIKRCWAARLVIRVKKQLDHSRFKWFPKKTAPPHYAGELFLRLECDAPRFSFQKTFFFQKLTKAWCVYTSLLAPWLMLPLIILIDLLFIRLNQYSNYIYTFHCALSAKGIIGMLGWRLSWTWHLGTFRTPLMKANANPLGSSADPLQNNLEVLWCLIIIMIIIIFNGKVGHKGQGSTIRNDSELGVEIA